MTHYHLTYTATYEEEDHSETMALPGLERLVAAESLAAASDIVTEDERQWARNRDLTLLTIEFTNIDQYRPA